MNMTIDNPLNDRKLVIWKFIFRKRAWCRSSRPALSRKQNGGNKNGIKSHVCKEICSKSTLCGFDSPETNKHIDSIKIQINFHLLEKYKNRNVDMIRDVIFQHGPSINLDGKKHPTKVYF